MQRSGQTTWAASVLVLAALVQSGSAQRGAGPNPGSGAGPSVRSGVPQNVRAPLRLVLVGDSTVTRRNGWGHGFGLLVDEAVEVVNEAAGGRSSRSYIDEGRWKVALERRGTHYLVQFGHNDEPGKGPERETDPATSYSTFMSRYVDDVRAIGATPILVTSMVRRTFRNGRIRSSLVPYVEAVRRLAAANQVPLIDLHASSLALAERMGEAAWDGLSPPTATGAKDRTHLNERGSLLVAPLVLDALGRLVPELQPFIRPQPLTGTPALRRTADAIVAADGSGQFRTVQDAVNASPQNSSLDRPWTIFIAAGTYRERVYVQREKRFLSLVGEDPERTRVTYDLHAGVPGPDGTPIGTFRTPTVLIDADDFTAENLTFENSAGPVGQALALRVDGDRVVFRNSRFLGWQDTMLLNRGRHYIEDSYVAGHVDFIFGGATAFFERCHLHALGAGYITAASTPREQPYGFVFAHGQISGAPGVQTYLGRPWREYAQVTFLHTAMSGVVRPAGWHNWDRPERERTTRYAEAGNTGPGAVAAGRVSWRRQLTPSELAVLTPRLVLRGNDDWDTGRMPARPSAGKAVRVP